MQEKIKQLKAFLLSRGVTLGPGLTDEEFEKIEEIYGFRFPKDLHQIYENFTLIGDRFYNWKDFSPKNIAFIRNCIEDALDTFDQHIRQYWLKRHGKDFSDISDEELKLTVPRMIPIYGHRYMPATPHESGNPVFSIVTNDMIYYGADIFHYFQHEFPAPCKTFRESSELHNKLWQKHVVKPPKKPIIFWDDMLDPGRLYDHKADYPDEDSYKFKYTFWKQE